MPKNKQARQADEAVELLRDLLITELGKAGVPQLEIRRIVGCDIHRVSRIVRFLKHDKI